MIVYIPNEEFIELICNMAEQAVERMFKGQEFLVYDEENEQTCYTDVAQYYFNKIYDSVEEGLKDMGLYPIEQLSESDD